MKLDHPLRHHDEVGHHVVAPKEVAHGLEQACELFRAVLDHFAECGLGLPSPVPGVLEGGYLGGGAFAGLLFEQNVVRGVGVEGRVEVDEVYRLIGKVVPEDGEVVTVVEYVRHGWG